MTFTIKDIKRWRLARFTAAQKAAGFTGAEVVVPVTTGSTAASTANTLLINTILAAGFVAKVSAPGITYIDPGISMPSDSTLDIAAPATLRQAPGKNATLIYNASRTATPVAIGAGALTSSGKTATLAVTGIGALFPANSYIAILSFNEYAFNGVWRVITSSANSITWALSNTPSATTATGAGTYTTAETNVNVIGAGTIDYDVANNGGASTLYASSAVIFFNCNAPRFSGPKSVNAKKYGVWFTNTANAIGRGINFNTSSDGVHVCGPQRGVVTIEDISGYTGDDVVGLSLGDNPTGELSRGEVDHVRIKNINGENSAIALLSIVGGGNAAMRWHTIEVEGVYGTCQGGAINIYEYVTGGATLSATYIETLILRDVMPTGWADAGCVYVGGTTSGVTIDHLIIENLKPTVALTGNQSFVNYDAKANVKKTSIRGLYGTFAAACQGAVVSVTSTASAPDISIIDFDTVPATSARNGLVANVVGTTLGRIFLSNGKHISAGAGYLLGVNTSCDIWINNVASTTTNSAVTVASTGAVVNLYTYGWKNSAGSTTPVFAVSGATLNWFGDCDCGTAKGAPASGSTFRAHGNMRVDASFINSAVAGDTFYNTNTAWSSGTGTDKSGFYGYNGSTYTKLFGPA